MKNQLSLHLTKTTRSLALLALLAAIPSCAAADPEANDELPFTDTGTLVQAAAAPPPGTAYVTKTFDMTEKPAGTDFTIATLDLPANPSGKYAVSFMVRAGSKAKGADRSTPWFSCVVKSPGTRSASLLQYFPIVGESAPAGRNASVTGSGIIVDGGLVELSCRSWEVGFQVLSASYTAVAGAGLVVL